ncbi:hypothetical protein [Streptosporangium sandarakinum]
MRPPQSLFHMLTVTLLEQRLAPPADLMVARRPSPRRGRRPGSPV